MKTEGKRKNAERNGERRARFGHQNGLARHRKRERDLLLPFDHRSDRRALRARKQSKEHEIRPHHPPARRARGKREDRRRSDPHQYPRRRRRGGARHGGGHRRDVKADGVHRPRRRAFHRRAPRRQREALLHRPERHHDHPSRPHERCRPRRAAGVRLPRSDAGSHHPLYRRALGGQGGDLPRDAHPHRRPRQRHRLDPRRL